jgi:molecular chaperone DnaK
METSVNLPFITADQNGPKHLQCTVTRATFESLCGDLFDRLRTPCEQCLKDAKLSAGDIQEVVMVGGSIRIPRVQQMAKDIFRTDKLDLSINPDEVVAIGAAIQGGVLQGEVKDVLLLDVTPLSLGVETDDPVTPKETDTDLPSLSDLAIEPAAPLETDQPLIDEESPRPAFESDPIPTLPPTPSRGDGPRNRVMTTLISRNTTIPTAKKEVFSTAADNQTSVTIHVLQGERQFAQDNRSLGRFDLTGIASAPRGVPQVEVEFNIDANGILNVKATDKSTGKAQEIKITGSSGLSKDEVERMAKEAEAHAAEDKARRELVDLKNQAEQVCYATEKALAEHGTKVSAETRASVESAVSNLRERVKGDDRAAIEAAMKQLNDASMELGKVVYESTKNQTQGAQAVRKR